MVNAMTVLRGFVITIASGIVFALVGAGLGYSLGHSAPDYYRTVLRNPSGVDFDPIQVGLGLGLNQGLAAGLLVGLVIVIAVAWYNSRLKVQVPQ